MVEPAFQPRKLDFPVYGLTSQYSVLPRLEPIAKFKVDLFLRHIRGSQQRVVLQMAIHQFIKAVGAFSFSTLLPHCWFHPKAGCAHIGRTPRNRVTCFSRSCLVRKGYWFPVTFFFNGFIEI